MGTARDRIIVSIYSEEYEIVAKKLEIPKDEISGRTVRVKLGLNETAKTTGINTQIRQRLRETLGEMDLKRKEELLVQLSKDNRATEDKK